MSELTIKDISEVDSSYMLEKKFELMIEASNKKITNEIKSVKEEMSKLLNEVLELKKSFSQKDVRMHNTFNKEVDGEIFNKQSPSKEIKPRYGDYKPEDVPIDKFFYFGRKV